MKNLPWSRILIAAYAVALYTFTIFCGRLGVIGETLTAGYFGLFLLLGTWLGVDFSGVISKSLSLPKGQAVKIKCGRYIFSLAILVAGFLALGFAPFEMRDRPQSLIVYAIVIVLGTYIAGRKSHNTVKDKCSQ